MRIDITTGDIITPGEIDYQYRSIFGDQIIFIKAYTLETILAEKYETILRRNVLSSIFAVVFLPCWINLTTSV